MPKNQKSILKNIVSVTVSNVSTIVAGILVGFLLPKILPLEDYGWYKTFTLYMTYVGFFSLGIIDGIVLRYGGYDYEELDRADFRSYFRWYISIHFFFACCVDLIAFLINDSNLRIILLFISVNMIAVNITGYFQQISQITQRFKEYSLRKIIQSILNILIVAILYGAYKSLGGINYSYYLLFFVMANIGLTIWYIYTYRDIVFGKASSLLSKKNEIFELCKMGFPLLFANLCSTLILTIDRQFVNVLFETSIYAKYAFAYNMLSLVTVATSAISTVLYPILKRTTPETMKHNYAALIGIISIIVFGAIISYYPLCLFVEWFLPQYSEALPIFRIIFPGLALSSSITVVMHNYYKAEGKNIIYFKKSILVLVISSAANAIAYYAFRTTISISIASIITMVFWYVYVEWSFIKQYKYDGKRNFAYIVAMMVAFYSSSAVENNYIGFAIYIALFIGITWILQKTTIMVDLKNMLKK